MKKQKIFLFVLLLFGILHASGDFEGIALNYSFSGSHSVSAGFCYSENDFDLFSDKILTIYGFSALTDIIFANGRVEHVGEKVIGNISEFALLEERLVLGFYRSVVMRSYFGVVEPEIGISFIDIVGLYYGYAFTVGLPQIPGIYGHKITAVLNFPLHPFLFKR
jgi:hypothetical protein